MREEGIGEGYPTLKSFRITVGKLARFYFNIPNPI